jgi:hypothetical protein
MIRKTVYSILFIWLFAVAGFSQSGIGRTPPPNPTPRKTPKPTPRLPIVHPTPIKTPRPTPSPTPRPTSMKTPRPTPLPPLANILWTDNCDPRDDPENKCQPADSLDLERLNKFYGAIKSVSGKLTYSVPLSKEDLEPYKVVIVDFCTDTANENSLTAIKEYIQSGGSAFIVGGNVCDSGGHKTSYWASELTKAFGVTFNSNDDSTNQWSDFIAVHPVTAKVNKMYFDYHSSLTVDSPSKTVIGITEKPIAAVYGETGSFVTLSDDGFGWGKLSRDAQSNNFVFWRNALKWLISRNKTKTSKYSSSKNADNTNTLQPIRLDSVSVTITEVKVGEFSFPSVSLADKAKADRINTFLIKDSLGNEFAGKTFTAANLSAVFTRQSGQKYSQGLIGTNYKVTVITPKVLSLIIEINVAGTNSKSREKYYNFDLSTGKLITLDQIITPANMSKIKKLVSADSKQRLMQIKDKATNSLETRWQAKIDKEYNEIELEKSFTVFKDGIRFYCDTSIGFPPEMRELELSSTYFYSWKVLKPILISASPVSSLMTNTALIR